jgi:glucose/arabinose dehydrogenase
MCPISHCLRFGGRGTTSSYETIVLPSGDNSAKQSVRPIGRARRPKLSEQALLKEPDLQRRFRPGIDANGSGERIYASGLQNPVGVAWAPGTRTLCTAVNERDELDDELVPDHLTSVQEGGFYGVRSRSHRDFWRRWLRNLAASSKPFPHTPLAAADKKVAQVL